MFGVKGKVCALWLFDSLPLYCTHCSR